MEAGDQASSIMHRMWSQFLDIHDYGGEGLTLHALNKSQLKKQPLKMNEPINILCLLCKRSLTVCMLR